MNVKLKKLSPDVKIPCYAHSGDAGMDLFSQENYVLRPGDRHQFKLGFSLELPLGFAAIVKDRSSLALNHGIHNLAGVIDSGYRGEYTVILTNLSDEEYAIEHGDKIAQLLILPIATINIEIAEQLNATSRGDGSFGSTGKR